MKGRKGAAAFSFAGVAHPALFNQQDEMRIRYAINADGTRVPGCVSGRMDPVVSFKGQQGNMYIIVFMN